MIQSHIKFLKRNGACREGIEWASENCETLHDAWDKAKSEWVVWLATQPGVLTERELHEFGLWCAEQVIHLMTDPRSIAALDAKRAWLDGKISDKQLKKAQIDAEMALLDAPGSSALLTDAALYAAVGGGDEALVRLTTTFVAAYVAKVNGFVYTARGDWLRANTKPKFPEVLR